MTDWPVKTLGDVCEIYQPQTIGMKDMVPDGPYIVYGANGPIGRYDRFNHENSEVTVTCRGATCGTVNVTPPYVWITGNAMVVRPREAEMSKLLLRYWLEGLDYSSVITGTAQPQITRTTLSPMNIAIPPLEEQKRIVALLDAATARVTELTACYEQARTHANKLFASALREALESNPDWPIKTLGQVATFHNGRAYKQQELLDKGKYRVLRVGNFFSSKSWYWSDLELDEHKYCDKGDLLYAWSASFGPRIWDEEKVIFHYHIWKVVEESQQINRQFLKYWLEEDVERVKSASGTGTTMMHVSKGNIEARLISLPPLEEQKRIVAQLDSMRAKTSEMVAAYDAKLQAARDLRQSILESVFAGDL